MIHEPLFGMSGSTGSTGLMIPSCRSSNGVSFLVVTITVTACLPDLFNHFVGKFTPVMKVAPSLNMSEMPGDVGWPTASRTEKVRKGSLSYPREVRAVGDGWDR